MSRQTAPEIRDLARELGLDPRGNCRQRLVNYALERVHEIGALIPSETASTLLQVVAGMVSVRVLFIKEDSDLDRYGREYQTGWPELPGQLRAEFLVADTLGLVLAHPAPAHGAHRNLAFIDARGERSVRAYFTAWHEIAHLLLAPQLSFSGFRRVDVAALEKKDPLESLVDEVAGELAFYKPFVGPALDAEIARTGCLTLDGVSRVRDEVAPEASFSAAAHAFIRMVADPMAFVVAEERLKPTEIRRLSSPQLSIVPTPRPTKKLRVASAYPNELARTQGFRIFRNMRVPPDSGIAMAAKDDTGTTTTNVEDQSRWGSGGRSLPSGSLRIEARKFGEVTYALVVLGPSARHATEAGGGGPSLHGPTESP